jgi:hypothetical protein
MNALTSRPARLATPLALAALLAWHPADPTQATELQELLTRWTVIHLGLLVALPLLALQLLHTLRGHASLAADLARVAAVVAVAFYAAFESLVGLGTGVLVRLAGQVPADQRSGALELAQRWWEVPAPIPVISTVAIVAWVVALTAAAVAKHRANAPRAVVWTLLASGWLFAAGHPGLTGAAAMVALAASAWLEQRTTDDVPVPA